MDYFSHAFTTAFDLIFSFDKEVYEIVWTSLRISIIAIVLATISCIPIAFTIAFNEFFGKQLILQTLNTLMSLPTVLVGLLLYGLLTRQGPLGEYGLLFTPTAMVIGLWVLIAPIIINLSIAALSSADPRLAATCKALGANNLQQGWLFVRELRFALMAAIIAGFGRAIGEVGIAMMLGGNIDGFTRTMTTAIALETSKGEFEFALALGILLLTVAFVVNLVFQRLQKQV